MSFFDSSNWTFGNIAVGLVISITTHLIIIFSKKLSVKYKKAVRTDKEKENLEVESLADSPLHRESYLRKLNKKEYLSLICLMASISSSIVVHTSEPSILTKIHLFIFIMLSYAALVNFSTVLKMHRILGQVEKKYLATQD